MIDPFGDLSLIINPTYGWGFLLSESFAIELLN